MPEHAPFRLRGWLVQPDLNRISRDGVVVDLEPQAMAMLVMLARQPNQVVTTDALIESIWSGRPMADNPLYKAVAKLRQALGDNAREPEYIETISKKGYRLIAPVDPVDDTNPPPRAHIAPGRTGRAWVVSMAIVAAVAAGLVWWYLAPMPATGSYTLEKMVTLPGSSYGLSFDHTGTRAVFVNARGGSTRLWLIDLDTRTPVPLAGAGRAVDRPAWRPNSSTVVFNSGNDLWSIQVEEDVELDDDIDANIHPENRVDTGEPFVLIENARNAHWSPDGDQLVFERGHEVWFAREDGLGQRRISEIEGRDQLFAPREPHYSPDGRRIVYFDAVQGPAGHIKVYDIENRTIRAVLENVQIAGGPVFNHDGTAILYHSAVTGRMSLWQVANKADATPQMLLQGTSDDREPKPVPYARALTYTSTRDTYQLLATEIHTGEEVVLYESRVGLAAPALSADETQVAFFGVTGGGGTNLFLAKFPGGTPQQITQGTNNLVMPKWSADDQWLYHYHASEPVFDYRRLNLASQQTETVIESANFNRHHDISIDPNARYALYALMERNRVLDTYIRDLRSGAEHPLGARLSWPEWASDGQRFVATDMSADTFPVGQVVLCRLQDANVTCDRLADKGQHPLWSADENTIYYVDPDQEGVSLWSVDVASRVTKKRRTLGPTIDYGPFVDVTRDERVVWVKYLAGQSELWRMNFD